MILVSNLDLLFVGITVGAIVILGFSVFFSDKNSTTNKLFLFFSLVTVFWGIVNYLSYRVDSPELTLWLLRLVIASAVWHAFSFFQLFYVFPNDKVSFPIWYKFVLVPAVFLSSLVNLTPLSFSRIIKIAPIGEVSTVDKGPGMLLFIVVVTFCIVGGLFLLIRKMIKAKGVERSQFRFIFAGTLVTFSLLFVFNFFLPAIFNNVQIIPFGGAFILPFIIFTSYTIIKHKLFNIRVAGTAVLVFSLSIVSFIEVTQTDNIPSMIYRSSVLFFILVFGILLIRGVLKEVRLREEIARMAEATRRAYEIEKKAKEELENLDKTKNQFILLIQHNLRTPLTSMMGYADLLLQGTFGKQNKETTEVIKRFQNSTKNLIRMVNDFLDITQFQLGKDVLSIKPGVDLNSILEEIIQELKFEIESKNIYLKLEKAEKIFTISADKEKLKAALFNIIHNAVKYTVKGGVSIKIENHGSAKVTVSDTGIGISPENIKTLFTKMFERGEQAKKTSSVGSGIGLYLASQIIKFHKGKIWVESEGEGKGSTFHIELPMG